MFLFLLYFLTNSFGSEDTVSSEEADLEIVVEASKKFEVYVAPIKYNIYDESIEAKVDPSSVFAYSSQHWKMAKVYNGHGGYEPITLNTDGFDVYSEETISYTWDNCNYKKDAKACSFKNNHYLLETIITVDENELTVNMMLYDSRMQVVATGSSFVRKKVRWIEQRESFNSTESYSSVGIQNCFGQGCAPNNIQSGYSSINNQPKEEIPLKFEIPHKLLNKHIHQASVGLWLGLRIK